VRVVFLTHYFPPEVGAPQTRIAALARGLSERGAEVTVHTGFPNYPEGRILPPYRNRPLRRERARDGTRIVRSAVYAARNAGFARRLANHASFAASALASAPASGRADVVVAESPPLFTAGAAVPYARAKRAALVINAADLWPDSAVAIGALSAPRAIAAARALEHWAYRDAAAITVPTEGMVRLLEAEPSSRGRAVHMPPAVDLERFEALDPPPENGPLRVLYAGTVGLAHGLGTLVRAAQIAGPETVQVTIAGAGAEAPALRARVAEERIANVALVGTVAAGAVPSLLAGAHAGVVMLRDRELFADALPTKLLECMAAGRPVVLSARGESAALVDTTGSGVVVPPEDPDALAGAFSALQEDAARRARMGAAGRAAARERYGRRASVDRWAALLERVAAQQALRYAA
jgi:glycosyltransferase involved in cell wall biosynthesis